VKISKEKSKKWGVLNMSCLSLKKFDLKSITSTLKSMFMECTCVSLTTKTKKNVSMWIQFVKMSMTHLCLPESGCPLNNTGYSKKSGRNGHFPETFTIITAKGPNLCPGCGAEPSLSEAKLESRAGWPTPTGKRYCTNSIPLKFEEKK
jgi:hypothetical protein